jgi:hypothetical protein
MPLILSGNGTIATSGTPAISIDAAGRVFTAPQPYVILRNSGPTSPAVLGSTDGSVFVRLGQNNNYLAVVDNTLGHWDQVTAYFTCPVAGFYQVSISGIKYPQAGAMHIDLRLNGVHAFGGNARNRIEETSSYNQYGSTYIIRCQAGDTLSWWAFGAGGWHEGHGTYSILFIG